MGSKDANYAVQVDGNNQGGWTWQVMDPDGLTIFTGDSDDVASALVCAQTAARLDRHRLKDEVHP